MVVYTCFPEGKVKALTMSYDDGRLADRRLVAIFNQYGIRGTFNLNAGKLDSPDHISADEVKALYQGHEVATHTYHHVTIDRCSPTQIYQEIIEDRETLESLVEYPVRGHAYPYGACSSPSKALIAGAGIVYARTTEETGRFELPSEWMHWNPTCSHNYGLLSSGEQFLNFHMSQFLKCMFVWGHSYEFDDADNWDLIEAFCRRMSGQRDIWYATNIEIHDYLVAAKQLQFTADVGIVYNPTAVDIWISADGDIIKIPGGEIKRLRRTDRKGRENRANG